LLTVPIWGPQREPLTPELVERFDLATVDDSIAHDPGRAAPAFVLRAQPSGLGSGCAH